MAADLRVGDFTHLPFEGDSFDLVLDRCAITSAGFSAAMQAVAEVRRVLVAGGKFLFNPYSQRHTSSTSGEPGPDRLTLNITTRPFVGVGQICFHGPKEIDELFSEGWDLISRDHLEIRDELQPGSIHAEWRVIAEKRSV